MMKQSLKDIARTGIFAAAPTALGEGYAKTGNCQCSIIFWKNDNSRLFKSDKLNLEQQKLHGYAEQNPFKTAAAMGSTDYAIKAAELNEDALAKYNADLARQGINDKAGRRAAIRAIYSKVPERGTWMKLMVC